MSEEESEPIPPSPTRVARRALVLSAVLCRAAIENDAGDADAEVFRQRVVEWLRRLQLTDEIEPSEKAMLTAPLGVLSERQTIDGSWRSEGLAVLAWALGRFELPAYDQQVDGHAAATALGFLRETELTALAAPTLRPASELRSLADRIFALHWRLRQFSLDGAPIDFKLVAAAAWFGPLDIAELRLQKGDLELRGLPICRAPKDLLSTAGSIARERQQAANWLNGQDAIYSEVTCDT